MAKTSRDQQSNPGYISFCLPAFPVRESQDNSGQSLSLSRPLDIDWRSEIGLQWWKKWSEVKVTQSCLTLCDPMGCSPWNLQVRILACVAFPFFRGSSKPWDQTQVSCIAGGFFISWATREAQLSKKMTGTKKKKKPEGPEMQGNLRTRWISKTRTQNKNQNGSPFE